MYDAYSQIFNRINLNFRAVKAETGSIGGDISHEFQVITQSGEDSIVVSKNAQYAANIELAEAPMLHTKRVAPIQEMRLIDTPKAKTINELVQIHNIPVKKKLI